MSSIVSLWLFYLEFLKSTFQAKIDGRSIAPYPHPELGLRTEVLTKEKCTSGSTQIDPEWVPPLYTFLSAGPNWLRGMEDYWWPFRNWCYVRSLNCKNPIMALLFQNQVQVEKEFNLLHK